MEWIQKFLLGRKQRVMIGGTGSEWAEVVSGVPQGSVLGPVLFICYINDMPQSITSMIYMYADDTKIAREVNGDIDHDALQMDLDMLGYKWAEKWQLRFNVDKCSVMHLGRTNKKMTYDISSAGMGFGDQHL
jgi:hypothetical protein